MLQTAATVAMIAASSWLSSASEARLEYEVKAAFLYNFAKFVGWPDGAFAGPDAPFVFCIHGEDPFGESIDRVVKGRTAHGRTIEVRRDVGSERLGACHLLFVGGDDGPGVARIVQNVTDTSVLTVGETRSFLDDGGIIELVVDDGKVRFEINAGRAERVGLRVSSQLLKLARAVKK